MRMTIVAAMSLLLAACATPTRWERAGASDERRALDLAECASFARNELRSHRGTARDVAPEADAATIGRNEDAAVRRRLREVDAHDRRADLIAGCMQAKGYARTLAGGRET